MPGPPIPPREQCPALTTTLKPIRLVAPMAAIIPVSHLVLSHRTCTHQLHINQQRQLHWADNNQAGTMLSQHKVAILDKTSIDPGNSRHQIRVGGCQLKCNLHMDRHQTDMATAGSARPLLATNRLPLTRTATMPVHPHTDIRAIPLNMERRQWARHQTQCLLVRPITCHHQQ
jgi:hypothetical protein